MSPLDTLFQSMAFAFVLTLSRVSGLFLTIPVFSMQGIPTRAKVFLAIGVSLVIHPLAMKTGAAPSVNLVSALSLVVGELVIGASVGFVGQALFSGLQLTGQIVSQVSGLSLSDVYNPTSDSNVPVFGQLDDLTALAVFVAIGGHREIVGALLDTYRYMPPGEIQLTDRWLDALSLMVTVSLHSGIRASAPVLMALLITLLLIGFLAKTLPQLNAISLGFSLSSLILLYGISLTIAAAAWLFQSEIQTHLHVLREAMMSVNTDNLTTELIE